MTELTSNSRASMRPWMMPLAIVLVLGAFTALTWSLWWMDTMPAALADALGLCYFAVAPPFEVFVHELGHYAAARAMGWRVPLFMLGPLTLRLDPLQLRIGAPAFGPNTAGAVVAVPPEGKGTRAAWVAVFAGGPAANILLAAALIAASFAASPNSTAQAFCVVWGIISLCSGLYNLLRLRGGRSDGAQILSLLAAKSVTSRSLRARLYEQAILGVRPRAWPEHLVCAVAADSIWAADASGQLLLYEHYMDRGETARARAILRAVHAQGRFQERILAEEAFLCAEVDGDGPSARAILARTHSWAIHHDASYWRAEAATRILECDASGARDAIRKGRIVIKDSPYATAFDREAFDRIEARLATVRT